MKAVFIFALLIAVAAAALRPEDIENHPNCPKDEDENSDHTLFAGPRCTTYYSCSRGNAILMKCREPLEFNKDEKACDWPENAKCSQQ